MTARREDNAIRGLVFGCGLLLLVVIGVIVLAVVWQAVIA